MVSARTVEAGNKRKSDMIRVTLAVFTFFSFVALTSAQQPAPKGNYEPIQSTPGARPAAPGTAPAPGTPAGPAVAGLSTPKQKASYGIGTGIGAEMRGAQMAADDIDFPALVRGITDALTKAKPALTEEEIKPVMEEFRTAIMKRVQDKGKKEGEAFLAANKTKEGVKTTASGLQYKSLKAGTGVTPGPTDIATVHYEGKLLDGTVFDSSIKNGQPASFPVNRVIPGWVEALQLMKVGDKWQLVIPSNLAYGENGTPDGTIAPNSVLVFEVELLDVKKAADASKATPQ
jgi:FKBP-type peptidyl-prolyl cis-trans isomerase FklB